MVIFQNVNKDQNHIPINSLLFIAKKYIFEKSRDGKRLNLKPQKHRLNNLLRDKEYSAKLNEKETEFSHVCDHWEYVFRSVH